MGLVVDLAIGSPASQQDSCAGRVVAPGIRSASAGLALLLLASALNAYQKNHFGASAAHGLWILGRGSFPVLLGLLGGFAWCAHRTLRPNTLAPAPGFADMLAPIPRGFDPLLILRAIACLMVLAGHGVGFTFSPPDLATRIAAGNPVWLVTSAPEAGVWVFFTLSGYLIGKGFFTGRYTANHADVRRYALNRLLRIIPLYWGVLFVVSVLFLPSIFELRNLPVFCNMLLFNLNGHLPYMPVKALWSLATEIQFYAAAPLLFILMRHLSHRPSLALVLAAAMVTAGILIRAYLFVTVGYSAADTHNFAPLYVNLDLFVFGMVASGLATSGRRLPRHALTIVLVSGAVLYAVDSYLRATGLLLGQFLPCVLYGVFGPSITALYTALAIFCLETTSGTKSSAGGMVWKRLEFLGVLTYGAYICHEPIFIAVKDHIATPSSIPDSIAICAAVIVLVFIMAALLHRLIESPLQRFHRS